MESKKAEITIISQALPDTLTIPITDNLNAKGRSEILFLRRASNIDKIDQLTLANLGLSARQYVNTPTVDRKIANKAALFYMVLSLLDITNNGGVDLDLWSRLKIRLDEAGVLGQIRADDDIRGQMGVGIADKDLRRQIKIWCNCAVMLEKHLWVLFHFSVELQNYIVETVAIFAFFEDLFGDYSKNNVNYVW